jgi:hypothetical protein
MPRFRIMTIGEMQAKPVRRVRVLRNREKDDGAFDLEFWSRVGAEGRFAAAWRWCPKLPPSEGNRAIHRDFKDLFSEFIAADVTSGSW